MIVCNGCPKSGTHALCALLDTMGLRRFPGTLLPCEFGTLTGVYVDSETWIVGMREARLVPDNCYILGHVPASYSLDGFRVITVIRDPRNMLASYVRHRKRVDGLTIAIPQALEEFWDWGPFVEAYRSFLGWIGKSIIIRYEDMPPAMIGDGSGVYRAHGQDWNTYTTTPSRWQDYWGDDAEAAWKQHGGPDLLAESGYTQRGQIS